MGHTESLIVAVDGIPQAITLSTNIATPAEAVAAFNSGLTGATARSILATNVEFSFELHSGDAYYMTRHEIPPLLLAPPFRHAEFGHGDHGSAVLCDIEHMVYFAFYGGHHCSEYDITLGIYTQANPNQNNDSRHISERLL